MTICRHINWYVPSGAGFGKVKCKDCGEELWASDALNATMEYAQSLIKELEAIVNLDIDKSVTSKPRGRPKKDG